MRILFTGHKGFLGKELISQLSEKYHIFTFDGDLLDYKNLLRFVNSNSITKVIHAAAKIDIPTGVNGADLFIENIEMIANIIKLQLPTLTFCSGKIFGYQNSIKNAKEGDMFFFPEDYYGQSKYIIKRLIENNENFTIIRYFNVFGYHEDNQRFIKANLVRYALNKPMIVNRNLEFDTFYVVDSLPIIESWIVGELHSKEINLVYPNKIKLTNICELINSLDNHKVEIILKDHNFANDYSGNGDRLSTMGFDLLGLEKGLSIVYSKIKNEYI